MRRGALKRQARAAPRFFQWNGWESPRDTAGHAARGLSDSILAPATESRARPRLLVALRSAERPPRAGAGQDEIGRPATSSSASFG
jgi:hypothetical protein